MAEVTYTITVRRVVEEDLDIQVTIGEGAVDAAIEQALAQAAHGFDRTKVEVSTEVVGNVRGSDGTLWI